MDICEGGQGLVVEVCPDEQGKTDLMMESMSYLTFPEVFRPARLASLEPSERWNRKKQCALIVDSENARKSRKQQSGVLYREALLHRNVRHHLCRGQKTVRVRCRRCR